MKKKKPVYSKKMKSELLQDERNSAEFYKQNTYKKNLSKQNKSRLLKMSADERKHAKWIKQM